MLRVNAATSGLISSCIRAASAWPSSTRAVMRWAPVGLRPLTRAPALVITRPMTNRTSPIPSTDSPTMSARSGVTLISCHFAVVSDVMPNVVMKPRMATKTPLNSVSAPSIVTKLPAPSRGGRARRSAGSASGLWFRP